EEALHRLFRLGQDLAVGHKAVALDGKDKAVRDTGGPLGEGFRLLAAIIGAVDLYGGKLAACIFKLPFLGKVVRIEGSLPRLERPASDTGANGARISHRCMSSQAFAA